MEHLWRTRRDKPWRDDGAYQRVFTPPPLFYQRLIALHHLLHRLLESFRAVAVHGNLAHQRTHTCLSEETHQQTGALGMSSGEHTGTHGAETPQVVHKAAVHTLSIGRIGIFHFLGKGVVL